MADCNCFAHSTRLPPHAGTRASAILLSLRIVERIVRVADQDQSNRAEPHESVDRTGFRFIHAYSPRATTSPVISTVANVGATRAIFSRTSCMTASRNPIVAARPAAIARDCVGDGSPHAQSALPDGTGALVKLPHPVTYVPKRNLGKRPLHRCPSFITRLARMVQYHLAETNQAVHLSSRFS